MSEKKQYKLTDQVIGQIREVLQLAMLTNTNFVDHMRAIRVEESATTEGGLILSEAYVHGWNEMAEKLHVQAEEKAKELGSTLADDGYSVIDEPEDEVVISRDSTTGKLVGTRQKIVN
jgi:hypothetical protein